VPMYVHKGMKTTLAPFRCTSQPRRPDSVQGRLSMRLQKKLQNNTSKVKTVSVTPKPKETWEK
jgi:hypothetical protein